MVHLSNYDFVFGGIILISAILAMLRGGVAELLSLSTWFLAFFVMRRYAEIIEKIIPAVISNELFRSLLTYLIAFLLVAVIMMLIKLAFHKLIQSLGLGGLNYMLGVIFGLLRGLIICALLIIILEIFNLDQEQSWQKSWLSPILTPIVSMIVNAIPDRVKNFNYEIGKNAEQMIKNKIFSKES